MERTTRESRWLVYTLTLKEFCEKLGLPADSRIVQISPGIRGPIEITCVGDDK